MKIVYTQGNEVTTVYESENSIDVKLAYKDMTERRNMKNLRIVDIDYEAIRNMKHARIVAFKKARERALENADYESFLRMCNIAPYTQKEIDDMNSKAPVVNGWYQPYIPMHHHKYGPIVRPEGKK